jgi:hypothetical protein
MNNTILPVRHFRFAEYLSLQRSQAAAGDNQGNCRRYDVNRPSCSHTGERIFAVAGRHGAATAFRSASGRGCGRWAKRSRYARFSPEH